MRGCEGEGRTLVQDLGWTEDWCQDLRKEMTKHIDPGFKAHSEL